MSATLLDSECYAEGCNQTPTVIDWLHYPGYALLGGPIRADLFSCTILQ